MTLADLTVDIVAIIGAATGKRRNRARNLLQQGTDLRAVIDILAGQLGSNDLSSVGVHPRYGAFAKTDASLRRASRPATHRDRRA